MPTPSDPDLLCFLGFCMETFMWLVFLLKNPIKEGSLMWLVFLLKNPIKEGSLAVQSSPHRHSV